MLSILSESKLDSQENNFSFLNIKKNIKIKHLYNRIGSFKVQESSYWVPIKLGYISNIFDFFLKILAGLINRSFIINIFGQKCPYYKRVFL